MDARVDRLLAVEVRIVAADVVHGTLHEYAVRHHRKYIVIIKFAGNRRRKIANKPNLNGWKKKSN